MKYILTALVVLIGLSASSQASNKYFMEGQYLVKTSVKFTADTSVTTTWSDVEQITINRQVILLGGTTFRIDSMTQRGFHFGIWRLTTRDKINVNPKGDPLVLPMFKLYKSEKLVGYFVVKKKS